MCKFATGKKGLRMKKFILILSIAVACLFGNNAMAYDFSAVCSTGQTLFYDNTSGLDYYSVSVGVENESYPYYNDNPTGDLVIPETVEFDGITYTVTAVGSDAFYNCSDLTSVVIPNTVTEIGYMAFSACTGLTSITLPSSLTNVVDQAFSYCNALSSIYYLGSIEQWCGITFNSSNPLVNAHNLYIDNTLVTDLVIPETITEIKSYAFAGASCLTSVTLPSSVTSINDNAFLACSSLSSIDFPSGVESIGGYAFQSCSALTSITVPNTLTTIGRFAFYDCTLLEEVYGFGQTSITSINDHTFCNNLNLANIELPNTLNTIEEGAFSNCGFTTINIPEGVTAISRYAFEACSSLTSLTLPSTLATIGEYAFGDSDLISVIKTYANTPPTINDICFSETTYNSATVWVPIGTRDSYMNTDGWMQFSDIREVPYYWSCDFEGGEMWTFGNDQQNGNVQWQIVTPETFPSNLISGTNAYFNPFVFQGDTLNETPEHWAMVELISQLTDLGGPGQVAESPWIEFSGIDLSEAQHPKITFRQMFRQLNGIETIVMVSADGQTWTEHNLNEEVESNQYGQNSITKGVNIYEAAGAENVTIRFLVNSDASVSQMGYGWQIDDIKILEAPACDLTLNAARISMFGYVDYRNLPDDFNPDWDESTRIDYAYQFYDPYAQSPSQQWFTQNGFAAFNIEVVNNGYDTITPKARVKVFNPNGDLIYDKIAEGTFALQSDQSDTLDLARNTGDMENSTVFRFYVDSEDEIALGRYNVEFEILTDDRDEDNTDNYSTQYFYINDSRYSPSYDQPNGYFWPSSYGTEVGTYFTYYYEPDRDVKVDAYIDAHTTAETQLQAIVYMYNNEEYTQVLSSDIVNITEDMLGSWVNFSFNGAFNVTFDEGQNSVEYLITIKTIEGTLAIGSYDLLTNKGKRTRIKNGDTWYYLGKNAAIRLREFEYAITVKSSNTEYGTVSGSGEYDDGSEVIITAMPKQGYRFVSWSDDNTDNPRTITVSSDSTFVANFESEPLQQYTITALANNEAYGSVSGGGTYEEGTDVVIMAMPNGGYLFDSWEDGNFDNPRTVTVTSDSTFVADFVKCEITQTIDTTVQNFVTVGDHTFYSTGRYSFEIQHEADCDTIFDINLTVLAEPEPFDIGPNPTSKMLNINSDGLISFVELYSTTGQLVMRKEVNGYEVECDVESLVPGVYIVRIYGAENNLPSVYKVVKE